MSLFHFLPSTAWIEQQDEDVSASYVIPEKLTIVKVIMILCFFWVGFFFGCFVGFFVCLVGWFGLFFLLLVFGFLVFFSLFLGFWGFFIVVGFASQLKHFKVSETL